MVLQLQFIQFSRSLPFELRGLYYRGSLCLADVLMDTSWWAETILGASILRKGAATTAMAAKLEELHVNIEIKQTKD